MIGFTGTQSGLTVFQKSCVRGFLGSMSPDSFGHGDCIGADFDAAMIANSLSWKVIDFPPENSAKRAFFGGDEEREPKPYLVRNHDIVDECSLLIVCPKGFVEQVRSGTWATKRYAEKMGRPVMIFYPESRLV